MDEDVDVDVDDDSLVAEEDHFKVNAIMGKESMVSRPLIKLHESLCVQPSMACSKDMPG